MSDHLDHPAVQANISSITLASQGDKEAWLALYADDAIVQDPVGVSPFDPTGDGHKGKEAIATFWDNVIGPSNLTITAHMRIPSGDNACAVHQSVINDMGNGNQTTVDMIAVYELNDEGKIKRMSAFWSWSDMEEQLKKLGFM
jgi:ketosteroid isomerase-like protein